MSSEYCVAIGESFTKEWVGDHLPPRPPPSGSAKSPSDVRPSLAPLPTLPAAKATVDHILSYMRSIPSWAYNGGARAADSGNGGKVG